MNTKIVLYYIERCVSSKSNLYGWISRSVSGFIFLDKIWLDKNEY